MRMSFTARIIRHHSWLMAGTHTSLQALRLLYPCTGFSSPSIPSQTDEGTHAARSMNRFGKEALMMEVHWSARPLPWAVLLFPACSGIPQQRWSSRLTSELHPLLAGRGADLARGKRSQQCP